MSFHYYVNISNWTSHHIDRYKSYLKDHEMQKVSSFRFKKDQHLALGSFILQYYVIQQFSSLPVEKITILRTRHNKPYWENEQELYYNVSHHGKYVVIATSTTGIVGVDIVDISDTRNGSMDTLLHAFRNQYSNEEIHYIQAQDTEQLQYKAFYQLWSLKEAFVKAIGTGISVDLKSLSFRISEDNALLEKHPDWNFRFNDSIDPQYICTTACASTDPFEYTELGSIQLY